MRLEVTKASKSPSQAELAYAAGFLEGDGCFHKGPGNGNTVLTTVSAVQKDQEPLDKLQRVLGGTIRMSGKVSPLNPSGRYWIWEVSGPRARGISMTLFYFLSERRRNQIRDMLSTWRAHRPKIGRPVHV